MPLKMVKKFGHYIVTAIVLAAMGLLINSWQNVVDKKHTYEVSDAVISAFRSNDSEILDPRRQDIQFFTKNGDNSFNRGTLDSGAKTQHIIILAAFRTGSSFTAELFNRNDDFFYVFEPGLLLTQCAMKSGMSDAVFPALYSQMLENILHCDFEIASMQCYLQELSALSNSSRLRYIPSLQCKHSNVKPCSISAESLGEVCRNKKHIAVKTIRVRQINEALHLIRGETLNTKLVHVIRDPRGRIASWLKLKRGAKPKYDSDDLDMQTMWTANTYCQQMLDNYIIGRTMTNIGYFDTKYTFVRYEDMAENPELSAEGLYKTLGLHFPTSIRDWLQDNTKTSKGGDFGTSRNSKQQAQSWRSKLTLAAVRAVEALSPCKKLLSTLGYVTPQNNSILLNLNISLVQKVPDFIIKEHNATWRHFY
ncbi:carbohydrate sulfotransferase 1-like [Saccoglossus kowalevskii]|uniref:Carbohydrate sulfotransferase 1-like n=1 Tax=Saccoglossus kowalevskii TaxID=10224 RepID=A0ABM0MTP1_SACKO|nr:PREDICTED: carbohydrate sulfotransferase 1-like [Saccoglossus kowalevskii]